MLQSIEEVLLRELPDWVLVYGDTNSTLAGALAACKLHIPTAHVEAGLRSYNRGMPEEINRVLTDHSADLLFAPTDAAMETLRREGLAEDKIRLVGDVMFDAALVYAERARWRSQILTRLSLEPKKYILATVHRAENTDNVSRLAAIVEAFTELSNEMTVVFPVHPRTRKAFAWLGEIKVENGRLQLIDPIGYLDMVALESHAALIATDSGGVQKEAFFHGVNCVTLREETEWVELIDLGWNRLLPPVSADAIASGIRTALSAPTGKVARPYGDGTSSKLIVGALAGSRLSVPRETVDELAKPR
jgi:UDP-GlcNAc3NAcA epimerase